MTCILLLLFFISNLVLGISSDHLLILKSKFPYGLLGDDYGILAMNDLAINTCYFKPKPFPPETYISPFEYWQCYESKNISFSCGRGVPDEYEGVMGWLVVKTFVNQIKHKYIERRPCPIRECRSIVKNLKLLLKGTSHACISGSFIVDETDKAGQKMTSWLFERLKTVRGCEGRGCNFTKEIKREFCPEIRL